MQDLKETQKGVEEWIDRAGLSDEKPERQTLKLVEELGELAAAVARNNREDQIDALGDIMVVATVIAKQTQMYLDYSDLVSEKMKATIEMAKGAGTSDPIYRVRALTYSVAKLIGSVCDEMLSQSAFVEFAYSLVMVATALNIDIATAYKAAYDVIKTRKGKMVNGVFVKEEDL